MGKGEDGILVGLDIGGTKTAVLIVDKWLNVLAQHTVATDVSGPDALAVGVQAVIHAALAQGGVGAAAITAIGAGVPGQVNPESGEVRLAVNLNLVSYPLGLVLSQAFGVPVILENDVRMAAVGAFERFTRAEPLQHLAYLSVGTGISAGVVLGGRLHRGANGMAGEIGHIVVEPGGPRCACGGHGCLEALAAGPAIAARWRAARGGAARSDEPISAADVYAAAQRGEEAACTVVRQVSATLARAIQLLIMAYDVEKVVVGGGVSRAGPAFLDPIQVALAHARAQSGLAQAMLLEEKVVLLPAGMDAATWGAITLARQARTSVGPAPAGNVRGSVD